MSVEVPSQNEQGPISMEMANNLFDQLFMDERNFLVTKELFKWIPGQARQQQVLAAIDVWMEWRRDLRDTLRT